MFSDKQTNEFDLGGSRVPFEKYSVGSEERSCDDTNHSSAEMNRERIDRIVNCLFCVELFKLQLVRVFSIEIHKESRANL